MKKEWHVSVFVCLLLESVLFLVLSINEAKAVVPVRDFHHYTYVDRIRVNVSLGPQVYMGGESDIEYGVKNRITPAFTLSMYQQFTQYFAYRARFAGGSFISAKTIPSGDVGNYYRKSINFSSYGAAADLMLSLNRVFSEKSMELGPNVWLFAGFGADAIKSTEKSNDGATMPSFNSGFFVQFPFSKRFDLTTELKLGIVSDKYNGWKKEDLVIDGVKINVDGYIVLLFGVTYKF